MIIDYGTINSKEEYENLKNVIFIFNVAIKLLICLHEIIILLAYGYLFHIIDRKIISESSKSQNSNSYTNSPKDDGGSYFEELLFGQRIIKITFNNAMRLLNGNFIDLNTLERIK